MKNINTEFGKRIRALRISQGLSQEQLAERSNLHFTYIGQIERGEKSPTLESVDKICKGLSTDLDKIFYNFEEKPDAQSESDYAIRIFNEILPLTDDKKKKIYQILHEIVNFSD